MNCFALFLSPRFDGDTSIISRAAAST